MTVGATKAPRPVEAGRVARGSVLVPPSKSVSNRYLNLALLARSPITIERVLDSDDIRHFRSALGAMGFGLPGDGETIALEPPAAGTRAAEIHCGI